MFQARIISPGKLKSGALHDLQSLYINRMVPPAKLIEIDSKKINSSRLNGLIRERIPEKGIPVFTLDEKGRNLTSRQFTKILESYILTNGPRIDFVIGPADGLEPATKKLADETISFGAMTWPHLITRLLLLEQLYRSQMILSGHPYHKD